MQTSRDDHATGFPELLNEIALLAQHYRETQQQEVLPVLRAARNRFAVALLDGAALDTPPEGLIPANRLMTQSGFKTWLEEGAESELLARAKEAIASAGDRFAAGIAAHCLLTAPHQIGEVPALERIPDAWLPTLSTLLSDEPVFWATAAEPARHLAFTEKLTAAFRALLEERRGERSLPIEQSLHVIGAGRFVGAYFADQPLDALSRDRAAAIEGWLEQIGVQLDHDVPVPPRPKLRVGCIRQSWREVTESASLLAHLRGLDDRFEIYVYTIEPLGESAFEREVAALADQVRVFPDHILAAPPVIRSDDLDILLIGHNVTATPYLPTILSAYRLARFQVATTVSPSTTGFKRVDAFLNGVLNEREGAQSDYTEPLLLSPASINLYEFHDPAPDGRPDITRASLGVGEDQFVFASGANVLKITAELIASWARILKQREDALLLLYPFNPYWSEIYPSVAFERHVRKVLTDTGVDPSRLRLLPQQPTRAHVRAVLGQADLYLDSFPYSGAVSILDPLAAGLPMLLYRGQQARCRQSAGMHAEFGLPALVAESPQAYEDMAVALSRDPDRLAQLRAEVEPCRARMKQGRLRLSDTLHDAYRAHMAKRG